MIEHLLSFSHSALAFVVVLSVIVFIHEFGHYFVARLCGVRIEVFSIGFGRELFGRNDRHGTRWKLSLLPLGGYVKMYGDASAASTADEDKLAAMTPEQRREAFHYKKLWQKGLIVGAGPFFNFLLTVGLFTYFIFTTGLSSTEPVAGEIIPDTPAAAAGLQAGDRILRVGDARIKTFADIPAEIATNLGTPVTITLLRGTEEKQVTLAPAMREDEDMLGNKIKRPLIGIKTSQITFEDVGLGTALVEAVKRTYQVCAGTLKAVGQMITGHRGTDELRGPLGIAQMSGQAADKGSSSLLWLIAMLSANLGLVNLFPIPLLDGGHLLFYAVEGARGRPMAEKIQEWSFRVGFALIMMLMAFSLFNDVRHLVS